MKRNSLNHIIVSLGLGFFLATVPASVLSVFAQEIDESIVRPVFRTRKVSDGRFDMDSGARRARYVFDNAVRGGIDEIMRSEADEFGWAADLSDLELIRDDASSRSRHLTYRQQIKGIPIEGRFVKLSLNSLGQPTMIISGYTPIGETDDISTVPTESGGSARSVALNAFAEAGGRASDPELIFTAEKNPRLAWKIIVWPQDEPAEWVVYVNAADGSVITFYDQSMSRRHPSAIEPGKGRSSTGKENFTGGATTNPPPFPIEAISEDLAVQSPAARTPAARTPAARTPAVQTPAAQTPAVRISGTGFVFDPDPITFAGVPYAPPYVDSDDAAVPELDAARKLVTLNDISLNTDGRYVLEGPFVRIVGANQIGTITYTPPAVLTPDGFRFSRSDDGFEAVNAYYHLDQSQRYVQSLGITDRRNSPFRINPLGMTGDDSFFFPSADMIVFGAGAVDDAEDASVLWHEYAHALLDDVAPSLFNTNEGKAFHEGWSDYWAASYARHLTETGAVARTDWERVFRWDSGDGVIWPGRVLDDFDRYPDGVCTALPGSGPCNVHDDGRLWATTMMEVYSELGREITDHLNLRSHQYLAPPLTFADAAEAIVQADIDFYAGNHLDVLVTILGGRGLIDAQDLGPSILHSPLGWTEDVGGRQSIILDVIGLSDPVAEVLVFYRSGLEAWKSNTLSHTVDNTYQGLFDLPSSPGTMTYYVQAADAGGRTAVLPENAPLEIFEFTVAPDLDPPVVAYQIVDEVPLVAWPPVLSVIVLDNFGLSSVTVSYRIEAPSGAELDTGEFNLSPSENDVWQAVFPVEASVLEVDARVFFNFTATDKSVSQNITRAPVDGSFSFQVVSDGLLAAYNFDGVVSVAAFTGLFRGGSPTFGLQVAHSGAGVAGTSLQSAYPEQAGFSSMELLPVNLAGVNNAILVFWHWYDFEHDGTAEPGSDDALLFDGANIKLSTDGGQTWNMANPEGGYSGTIAGGPDNPLSGEKAFGGYGFGWRQEIIPLPASADTRIRFEFGTDATNTEQARWFAGWSIDDIQITTVRPADGGAPVAVELPPQVRTLSTMETSPGIEVRLTDDNGIADVFADYTFTNRDGMTTGALRLEMDPTGLTLFTGNFDFITDPSPSDRLTYRLRAQDFIGNTAEFQSGNGTPFQIDYLLIDQKNISQGVATSGMWISSGAGWTAEDEGLEEPPFELSSINMVPINLPVNSSDSRLVLRHSYRIFDGTGGNLKISDDGGRSWRVLEPAGGYGANLSLPDDHPMFGEPGFVGVEDASFQTIFPLDEFVGRQVYIRVDFATTRKFFTGERWSVNAIEFIRSTGDDKFDVERKFAIHFNYPNPFSGSTRIGFTVDEPGSVSLELYDLTGRRVRTVLTGFKDAGSYEETLDAGNLAGGMYILRLLSGGKSTHRSITVIR